MKSLTELAGGEFCLPLEEEEVRFVSYIDICLDMSALFPAGWRPQLKFPLLFQE